MKTFPTVRLGLRERDASGQGQVGALEEPLAELLEREPQPGTRNRAERPISILSRYFTKNQVESQTPRLLPSPKDLSPLAGDDLVKPHEA